MIGKLKKIIIIFLKQVGRFRPVVSKNVLKRLSVKNSHVFFGYYDITPFNDNNTFLLANHVPQNRLPHNTHLDLGYFNLNDTEPVFKKIADTKAWCWQMGARLRWIKSAENIVSYNSIDNNNYVNIYQDIMSGKVLEKHELPFYDINRNNSLAISLNFSRLDRLRPGYGYSIIPDASKDENAPSYDGLILYDILKKEKKELISLEQIKKIKGSSSMEDAQHYFNHISFSPYSDHFIFFHLWTKKSKRYSRLFIYHILTNEIELLSKNNVSHYTWKNNNEILITEFIDRELMYNVYDFTSNTFYTIGNDKLVVDGHPSCLNNNEIITDTYPNLLGYQKLSRYDLSKDKIYNIGKFYSPYNYKYDNKCDLHPRLSPDKKFICVDSAFSGKRELIIINN